MVKGLIKILLSTEYIVLFNYQQTATITLFWFFKISNPIIACIYKTAKGLINWDVVANIETGLGTPANQSDTKVEIGRPS